MQVDTYLFGAVEVSPEKVITFPQGLPGFESSRQFMLVHAEGAAEPASYTLQSLDDPALAFEIVDPASFGFSYELALSDADLARKLSEFRTSQTEKVLSKTLPDLP